MLLVYIIRNCITYKYSNKSLNIIQKGCQLNNPLRLLVTRSVTSEINLVISGIIIFVQFQGPIGLDGPKGDPVSQQYLRLFIQSTLVLYLKITSNSINILLQLKLTTF